MRRWACPRAQQRIRQPGTHSPFVARAPRLGARPRATLERGHGSQRGIEARPLLRAHTAPTCLLQAQKPTLTLGSSRLVRCAASPNAVFVRCGRSAAGSTRRSTPGTLFLHSALRITSETPRSLSLRAMQPPTANGTAPLREDTASASSRKLSGSCSSASSSSSHRVAFRPRTGSRPFFTPSSAFLTSRYPARATHLNLSSDDVHGRRAAVA
jgi:hypothetical protein